MTSSRSAVRSIGVALVVALLSGVPVATASAAGIPYDDPYAIGSLTLCDQDLQPVTGGSLTDRPFVWRAVSDTSAPAPYNNGGRRAVLYYVQPRENVNPLEWNHEILTAPSTYSDPKAPIAQATPIDYPLIGAVTKFPANWDGYIQLRMYFTTNGQPQSADYVSADIRVQGDGWSLVNGGDADCDAGKAVSAEKELVDYQQRLKKAQKGSDPISKEFDLPSVAQSSGAGSGDENKGLGANKGEQSSSAVAADVPGGVGSAAPSGGGWLWGALLLAVLIFASVGGAVAWVNRRD